jgi:hypothetical protein
MKTNRQNAPILLAGVVLAAMLVVAGCAGHKVLVKTVSPGKMIHYSELQGWDETKSLNGHVIYINAGETIPLKITMESDFMAFKQDHVDLVAKQKLYFMIKMPENLSDEGLARINTLTGRDVANMSDRQRKTFFQDYMLYLSRDAAHWAPLYGSRAYRKVLGFKEGTISLGLMAGTRDGLAANLGIRTIK